MTNYMSSVGKLPQSAALWIGTSCLTVVVVLLPLMGWLSDRLGRRPLLIISCIGYAVFGYPFFLMAASGNITLAVVAQLLMVLLYVPFYAEISDTRALYRVVDRLQYSCTAIRQVRAVYQDVPGAGDRQQALAGRLCHHRRNHHSPHPIAHSRNCVCAAAMIGWIVFKT
jgi:nitrate/nitrite transporter NarK